MKIKLALLMLLVLMGCSSSEEPVATSSFVGTWDTDWGEIIFTQTGSAVTGSGQYDFEGYVVGEKLNAEYSGEEDSGKVVFILTGDGKKFHGEYVSSVGNGTGFWSGYLSDKYSFSGTWDTEWGTIIFTQSENTVIGSGRYNFKGHVEGRTLMAKYTGEDDSGKVEFKLIGDGRKFHGEYVSSDGHGTGFWNGNLIERPLQVPTSPELANYEGNTVKTAKPVFESSQESQIVSPGSTRQSWAVVIGISQYKYAGKDGLENLIFADDDAKGFARSLSKMGWAESHIKLLINENATKRNIEIAIESWLTKAGPQDQVILYWAGHGYPDPENQEKVYFTTYDTKLSIPATGYRMDRVRSSIEELKSKNVVILADACHAGKLITRGQNSISILPEINRISREQQVPRGWIYMVGAATDRQAIEHTSWSNGAFTHVLLKGLDGEADGYQSAGIADGIVTMGELKAYLSSKMPDVTQKVLGVAKHPIILTNSGNPEIWNISFNQME